MHPWHRGPVPESSPTPVTAPARELLVALYGVMRRLKPRTSDGRLDPSSVFVLHQVQSQVQSEETPPRLSELARCMSLDASTVSRHVRQLETAGYVTRTGDPQDGRAYRVQLTPSGRELLDTAMRKRVAIVDAALGGWSERDRTQLITLVTRLAEDIDRHTAGTESR
jgi:DNA-binding MarR family transcriptional regulator